jgi:hypothetical protein
VESDLAILQAEHRELRDELGVSAARSTAPTGHSPADQEE